MIKKTYFSVDGHLCFLKKYLALFLLSLITLPYSFAQTAVSSDSTYQIHDPVLIPTQSGVDISAIIVNKKSIKEPVPVVLFYTTYHQGERDAIFAKWAAERDYVGVVAYARGVRTNMENYTPYEHEQSDIYDVIDWLSKQDWSSGEVGMFGGSYTGFSQWAATKKLHSALKTIVPQVAIMPGYDFPMQNNVPLGFELNWAQPMCTNRSRYPVVFFGTGMKRAMHTLNWIVPPVSRIPSFKIGSIIHLMMTTGKVWPRHRKNMQKLISQC